MIWTKKNGQNKKVLDSKGVELKYVHSCDDETGVVVFFFKGVDGWISDSKKLIKATAIVPGIRVVDIDEKS